MGCFYMKWIDPMYEERAHAVIRQQWREKQDLFKGNQDVVKQNQDLVKQNQELLQDLDKMRRYNRKLYNDVHRILP